MSHSKNNVLSNKFSSWYSCSIHCSYSQSSHIFFRSLLYLKPTSSWSEFRDRKCVPSSWDSPSFSLCRQRPDLDLVLNILLLFSFFPLFLLVVPYLCPLGLILLSKRFFIYPECSSHVDDYRKINCYTFNHVSVCRNINSFFFTLRYSCILAIMHAWKMRKWSIKNIFF